MSRRSADPSQLIERLRAAQKAAKPRDVADANLMADICRMTWRNLKITHIDPDPQFPIKERGSEGRGYQFEIRKVLAHMIKRAEQRQAKNAKRSANAARLTGFHVPVEAEAMDLNEIGKLADLTIRVQQEKQRQKYFVPAAIMSSFLASYNGIARDAILGTSAVIDPTGDLSPQQRTLFNEHMRNIAVDLQSQLDKFIGEWSAGLQQS
jgi:hypothetical protein